MRFQWLSTPDACIVWLCLIDRKDPKSPRPNRANPEAPKPATTSFQISAVTTSRRATSCPACAIASRTSSEVIDTHAINNPMKEGRKGQMEAATATTEKGDRSSRESTFQIHSQVPDMQGRSCPVVHSRRAGGYTTPASVPLRRIVKSKPRDPAEFNEVTAQDQVSNRTDIHARDQVLLLPKGQGRDEGEADLMSPHASLREPDGMQSASRLD